MNKISLWVTVASSSFLEGRSAKLAICVSLCGVGSNVVGVKKVRNSEGELTHGGREKPRWDALLATPSCGAALREIEHLVGPEKGGGPLNVSPCSHSQAVASILTNLFREISRYRILTPDEERQVALAIQTSRQEFHQALFSFMPVARSAVALVREATAKGVRFHYSRILHVSTVDSESKKRAIVAVANRNLPTIDMLLSRCDDRWSKGGGSDAPEASCAHLVAGLARDRGKIASLLSEIAVRPAFFAKFLSQFGDYVVKARTLYQEAHETSSSKRRDECLVELKAHLESSQETYDTLLEKWDRTTRAHSDYQTAQDILITRNLRLAISEAKKFANRGIPLEDLAQEAVSGLINAVEGFDQKLGYRFSTYATPWIRQAMYRSIDETARTVRIPGRIVGAFRKVEHFRNDFRGIHGRNPSPEEIAEALKGKSPYATVTAAFVWNHQAVSQPMMSLESRDGENVTGMNMRESITDSREPPTREVEDKSEHEQRKRDIDRVLAAKLNPRECQIIRLRFGLDGEPPRTLREVGDIVGLTKERVRQLEKRAKKILGGSELAAVHERGLG